MTFSSTSEVAAVIDAYSPEIAERLYKLRELILETAAETDGLKNLEETLKWGEPAYLTKYGSTIRIDWKKKKPEQYAIYFKCTSKLVPTFKAIYPGVFNYENNRAILFSFEDELPRAALKHCIQLALTYHRVKHLPLLGASA